MTAPTVSERLDALDKQMERIVELCRELLADDPDGLVELEDIVEEAAAG